MNWLEIIRLFILLWPHIEKILKGIENAQEREQEKEKAIAAIIQTAKQRTHT